VEITSVRGCLFDVPHCLGFDRGGYLDLVFVRLREEALFGYLGFVFGHHRRRIF